MKRNILLIGAGKSSGSLISYFLDHAKEENWELTISDLSIASAAEKLRSSEYGKAIQLDIGDTGQVKSEISKADIVVSLLPAHLHIEVAIECVRQGKNMATASYVSKEMQELHQQAKQKNIILMNECGLDPGIDHMSAMKIIDQLRADSAELISFKSYTGGLLAPESNDNPWGYKFSWNPRNVILAGQGTARYIENRKYKYIPYQRLFSSSEVIKVNGVGEFEGYPNRDSLSYRKIYGIENISTILRGTLREKYFCEAWNVFVQLGLTDDTYPIDDSKNMTYAQLIESFLPISLTKASLVDRLADFSGVDPSGKIMKMIQWTGILSDQVIGLEKATPAQILQHLLEPKWKLQDNDKDRIVMQHIFKFKKTDSNNIYELRSSMVVNGENSKHTAMAKTVGLPLAIVTKMILNKKISRRGVIIPVDEDVYLPVLQELNEYGIKFQEEHHVLSMSL